MILECPSCDARFLIPDAAVAGVGRKVRCGRCQYMWTAKPKPTEEASVATPDITTVMKDSPISAEFPAAPGGRRPRPSALPAPAKKQQSNTLAYVNGVLAAAVILFAAFVYAPGWMGFKSTSGLTLTDLSLAAMPIPEGERFTPDTPLYSVKGKIKNNSEAAIPLASLRVALVDDKHSPVRSPWNYQPDEKTLAPGQAIDFNIERLPIASPATARLQVDLGNWWELLLRRYE